MAWQSNEAWIESMAEVMEDPYKPCPCGCGTKWRFVLKSGKLEEHENKFREEYARKSQAEAVKADDTSS